MKNFSSVRKIPAFQLITPELSKTELMSNILTMIQEKKTDEDILNTYNDGFSQKVKENEEIQKWLRSLGVDDIFDLVTIKMTLGEVFWNCYASLIPEPNAPIAKIKHANKIQDLLKELSKDEFGLPEDVRSLVVDCMEDEEKWSKVSLSISYQSDGKDMYLPVISKSFYDFPDLANEAIKALGV
jgi:hypothetical protein